MLGFGVILAYTILQTTSGQNLHWSPASAPYSVNTRGSADISDGSEITAVAASFDAWNAVANFHYHTDCETSLDAGSIHPGNEVTDGNSIVTWVESNWVYGSGTIGITFNWFDPNTGVIAEADMMANGQDFTWTTGDTGVQTDVRNFLTHEAGHYLGMGHSTDTEATMFASGPNGETKKRTLDPDDIAGVVSLYGAGNTGSSGTPRQCSATSTNACKCELGAGPSRSGILGVGLAAFFAAAGFAARRRRGLAAAIVAMGILSVAPGARATSMRDLSLPELTRDSESVVVGTVESVETVTDGQTIRTVNRVVVHEVLAGRDFGTVLDVWTPGGELPAGVEGPRGLRGLMTSGVPKFLRGDEVVVFGFRLPDDPASVLRVSNLAQGKMEVRRDPATGTARLVRDLSGISRVVRLPDGSFEPAPVADPLGDLSLDSLRAALRGAATRDTAK